MTDHFDDWLTEHQVQPLFPPPQAYDRIATTARRRRTRRAVITATALAVVLLGAGGTAYRIATSSPPPPVPGTTTSQEPTQAPTSNVPSIVPSSAPPESPNTGRCRTGDLKVTSAPSPGGGAAGSVYTWLIFTNTSGRSCTLFGFPGVSYVTGPSGQQVNDPAKRSGSPSRLTLAPGKAAHAQLQSGHPEAFPDTCRPVAVAGYRVYAPDETASVFVAAPMQQCSANGVNVMTVNPLEPGGV